MLINLVARLSCGHDLTLRGVSDQKVPVTAWCPQCEAPHSLDKFVDNKDLRIS